MGLYHRSLVLTMGMHRIGGVHDKFTHHISITILRQNERLKFGAHESTSMTEAVEKSLLPEIR